MRRLMKPRTKKLNLSIETIHNLRAEDLTAVAGRGAGTASWFGCDPITNACPSAHCGSGSRTIGPASLLPLCG